VTKLEFILKITGGNKNAEFKWIDMQDALYDKFGYFSDNELIDLMNDYDSYILGAA
jgi:hypothetical protein